MADLLRARGLRVTRYNLRTIRAAWRATSRAVTAERAGDVEGAATGRADAGRHLAALASAPKHPADNGALLV